MFCNSRFHERLKHLTEPTFHGSYREEDCIFVLKDIGSQVQETDTEEKESNLAKGIHYSEMIPKEYFPTQAYIDLFHQSLEETAERIAQDVASLSELILREKGQNVVLVSLARAGTPVGVLIKRYFRERYGWEIPHYSISIIRDKGIDENALIYIMSHHPNYPLQFLDGWTGKGVINAVLNESISQFNAKYDTQLDSELAVLADPSRSTSLFATREDFLIPSACLNSTVSGLASRTFHKDGIIGTYDYHGAKYYAQWEKEDVSNAYIEIIAKHFASVTPIRLDRGTVFHSGLDEVKRIQQVFGIGDINKVKPGVGETTRVLLRRVPWKILVNDSHLHHLKHVLLLANDRSVPIERYNDMNYSCMGLIREEHA